MSTEIALDLRGKRLNGEVNLPLSKSLCNRALVLAALFPHIKLLDISDAEDTRLLMLALTIQKGKVDVGAAGTAMRFATAYFAAKPNAEVTLLGTARMHQRPIGVLVDALCSLGAEIRYLGEEGFPPLHIKGKLLQGGQIEIPADTSSQFITALMLVAPALKSGLTIRLQDEVVSAPYIAMTGALMQQLGFVVELTDDVIAIKRPRSVKQIFYNPEPDWSAAAYWYGFVALSEEAEVLLLGLSENSLQGDARLVRIFEELGVKTTFIEQGALLLKRAAQLPGSLIINLNDTPDLAQPLAVTCAALGIGADFRGLQTLRIKETDRLLALQTELAKVGLAAEITESTLKFQPTKIHAPTDVFETYEDHRMAMSLALLAMRFPITINNPEVVAKSYPGFWEDLKCSLR